MKQYSIKIPTKSQKTVYVITRFLGEGGFLKAKHEWYGNGQHDIEFVIECNSDTEFADLFMEIGRMSHHATESEARVYMLNELREKNLHAYVKEINDTCQEVGYPGGTTALYDDVTDTYYNRAGQKLKRPEDYHPDNDGRYY